VLTVSWLGHSTVVLDLAGTRVLTDPLLQRHAWPLRRRTTPPVRESWADPDAVLISHLHHDHAELSSLRMVADAPVLTAEENAAWLRKQGLRGEALGDDWRPVGDAGVEVRLVPAVHHSRPMPHRPNAANGHLLRHGATSIWAAGDTSRFDGMEHLAGLAGGDRLDLALIPIAGWGPRLSDGHLDGPEAARVCATVKARYALPVHWGTLHPPLFTVRGGAWMARPREHFLEALASEAPDTEPVDLLPGGTVTLPLG
jgi:L-ascorbate metabolism protein UlaG (beta-lactamase superfamily)